MSPLAVGLTDWHRICRACSYEGSVLVPVILEQRDGGDLDEHARKDALQPLRLENFARIAAAAREQFQNPASGLRALDVGCAHGWFLQELRRLGFDVTGIEPDAHVEQVPGLGSVDIRHGFFPDVLGPQERFDLISFNDVLEHIPAIDAALAACRMHLEPNGVLVVNAPDRTGALYRLSKLLCRLGAGATFARMWQDGFPSPHVHYLDSGWFVPLAGRHGFRLIKRMPVRAVSSQGLYERIRYDRTTSHLKAVAMTAAIALALPVLNAAPSDTHVWIFRRGD